MRSKIKNKFGSIEIENEVIARLAGLVAMECYGVVGMAARNMRDGFVHLLRIESLTKGIKIKTQNDGDLYIDMHIIVDYGTNITAIAQTLMENVKYKIEEAVGLTVCEVNVYIESVRFSGQS